MAFPLLGSVAPPRLVSSPGGCCGASVFRFSEQPPLKSILETVPLRLLHFLAHTP